MITAKEAYIKSVGEIIANLSFIEEKILNAIRLEKCEIIIREEPYSKWLYKDTFKSDFNAQKTMRKLKELGYKLSLHYEVKDELEDIGLIVNWDLSLKQ